MSKPKKPKTRTVQIDKRTEIRFEAEQPIAIISTRRDLQAAYDDAEQWLGYPLHCGQWEQVDDFTWRIDVWTEID